jgi:hypothetical protein
VPMPHSRTSSRQWSRPGPITGDRESGAGRGHRVWSPSTSVAVEKAGCTAIASASVASSCRIPPKLTSEETWFHAWPQPVSAPPLTLRIVSSRPGAVERVARSVHAKRSGPRSARLLLTWPNCLQAPKQQPRRSRLRGRFRANLGHTVVTVWRDRS